MIPDRLTWKKPTELVLPPPNKRTPGRPKINRARGADEEGRSSRTKPNRCGRCKEYGHNSRTCKNEAYVRPPRRGRGNGRGVSRGGVGNAGDGVGVVSVRVQCSDGVGVPGVPGSSIGVPGSSIGVPGSSNAYDGAGVGFFGDFSSQATGMTSAACFQPRFALGTQESTNAAGRCNE
ncbi:proline-rich receptor-like protein kinase PERK2 [Iris pallida]|uniref:Proline-rich receptor-like protein kinase PERK2 n=1 Tax=Iris pallida TaxID=29817 RepID=A0AAX6IFZ8_IRIPA|nr:proline-rich receptor-like protein kinase PERK2 [Iris pallida]